MSNHACPLRILVGIVDICGQLVDFAEGFRTLGHQVTTVTKRQPRWFGDHQYDVDLKADALPLPHALAHTTFPAVRIPRGLANRVARLNRIRSLIARHDVFLFLRGGSSLLDRNRDFPILKAMGKNIVSVFTGSDIRDKDAFCQQFCISGESHLRLALGDKTGNDRLRTFWNLRMAERYSDLILSVPNQSSLALRPYMHFSVPLRVGTYECHIPGRHVPVVVHAATHRGFKGSDVILSSLERLRAEGVAFELRFLQKIPNRELIRHLRQADVVVEQLFSNLHGKLGVEAMASGCALACSNREEYEPYPPDRPILHVDSNCVYEKMKRLLTNRELRISLATRGRAYVEQYHDHVKVCERIMKSLLNTQRVTADHYPTFFASNYSVPADLVIPTKIRRLTAQIVRRYGLPEGLDVASMIERDLLCNRDLGDSRMIPRWHEVDRNPPLHGIDNSARHLHRA